METETNPPGLEPGRPDRARRLALTAGLLAGLASWSIGEVALDRYRFEPPADLLSKLSGASELGRLKSASEFRGATLSYTVLGAALGLALGLAGGLARRPVSAGRTAALLGATVGAGAGLGASLVLVPRYDSLRGPISDSLLVPLMLHGGIWGAVGAAGGLAFGWGRGSRGGIIPCLLGGLAGALLGTIAFELVGAVAFPASGTTQPVPATWGTRLSAQIAVAFSSAAGASGIARAPMGRRAGEGSGTIPEPVAVPET